MGFSRAFVPPSGQDLYGGAGNAARAGKEALDQAVAAALVGAYPELGETSAPAPGPQAAPPVAPPAAPPRGGGAQPNLEEALAAPVAPAPVLPTLDTGGVGPGVVQGVQPQSSTTGDLFAADEAAEMAAIRESLGFEWANPSEIDPQTGRPAQPRTVDFGSEVDSRGNRGPEQLYTPPKESRGGNVSTMSHPEQGMIGADARSSAMSPNQQRAHLEDLTVQAEAERMGALAQDPYAQQRAEAGAEAAGKIRVEQGKADARARTTREAMQANVAQLVALQGHQRDELEKLDEEEGAGLISADERKVQEDQIRQEVSDRVRALRQGAAMAHGDTSWRGDEYN